MKNKLLKSVLAILFLLMVGNTGLFAQRQMEYLDRGLVGVKTSNGVFISWRILGNEWDGVSYNLYRGAVKIATISGANASNYTDLSGLQSSTYHINAVVGGIEQAPSAEVGVWADFYKTIDLQRPLGVTTPDGVTCSYTPIDCSVGDLNGDGQYEIVVKWEPSNAKDNSQSGYTGNQYIEAYTLNGTRLWRIDLGINIRAGAHYTQFMVYDFNGDGLAEMVCKTADGTKDGLGTVIGNGTADYRNTSGYILSGPEYLTVFRGSDGGAITTINYNPPRGLVSDWGDSNGNRVDRFLACVAYLNGKTPSVVMCRGYYTRTVLVAYDFTSSNTLTQKWIFDSNVGYNSYAGMGNHNISVADVDNDGKDEIVYGSMCVDDNGSGKWNSGLGHGDAMHLTDIDPNRPGLEVWGIHEGGANAGSALLDAKTGAIIWKTANADVGRGLAADVTSTPGVEVWGGTANLRTSTNMSAGSFPASSNFATWWDGDEYREILDGTKLDKYGSGRLVTLYNYATGTACNGTKNTPNLQADILGDWREEIILHSSDNTKLIIFTTTTPTNRRLYTLMHDPVYRLGIAWQNVAYNQPPHTSFFLGGGMDNPPAPQVFGTLQWKGSAASNVWDINTTNNWLKKKAEVTFSQNDTILFDASGISNVPVTIAGTVAPGKLFINSSTNYEFGGTGMISGNTTLTKSYAGTVTFNNKNTYTGLTEIWDGAIIVNDSLKYSAVDVHGGTWGGVVAKGLSGGRIGGNGYIGGGLTLYMGGSILPGNGMGNPDTITIANNLIIKKGAVSGFDLSDDPHGSARNSDYIKVLGNVNMADGSIIYVNLLNSKLSSGSYRLFSYSGTLTGNLDKVEVAGINGVPCSLADSSGYILLRIMAVRAPKSVVWAGSQSNTWDMAKTLNWKNDGVDDFFVTGDSVRFDVTGSSVPNVTIPGFIKIGKVIVDGASNYTFSGAGSISGAGGITKNGTGTLVINTTNTYTGPTIVKGGILEAPSVAEAGAPSSIGSSGTDSLNFVIDGGTFRFTDAFSGFNMTNRGMYLGLGGDTINVSQTNANLYISGVVSGPGKLIKTGPGTLTLNSVNKYRGGTVIKAGTLNLGTEASINNGTNAYSGLGSGTLTIENGTLNMYYNEGTYTVTNLNIIVPNTDNARINLDGRNTFGGTLTGSGNLTLYSVFARTDLNGNWSAFTGRINLITDSEGGDFRINNNFGYAQSSVNLASNIYAYRNGGGSVAIGELSGATGSVLTGTAWTIGAKNTNATFSGNIMGNSITKVGSGTWTITGNNLYSGGTLISAGKVLVNNTTGRGAGSGNITVSNGAVLGGTGYIKGIISLNSGATLEPGNNGIGTLTDSSSLTLPDGSVTAMELRKSPQSSDLIRVVGTLAYGGTLHITNIGTVNFAVGDSYKLFSATAYTGSFNSIIPATPGTNMVWDTSELNSTGTIKVALSTLTPEINGSSLTVFPNPVKDMVTIELPSIFSKSTIELYNSKGVNLILIKPIEKRVSIDMKNYPSGIYIVRIIDGGEITNKLIVKL